MKKEIRAFVENAKPLCNPKGIVQGKKYRFSVLTDRLVRMEYRQDGAFVDSPTQQVINRDFPVPDFQVTENEGSLEITTKELHIYYDLNEFSSQGLWITLEKGFGVYGSTWTFGETLKTLKGTARTLDNADGEIDLEDGVVSRDGFALLDDSKSAILNEKGWIEPRKNSENSWDLYFFGYGHDYEECIKDFYRLCGQTPLLPRYTMGNWWSRFYPYTQKEYLNLMDKFRHKNLPMAVSVIDMDWHKTSIPEKYGSGWTGYSWNKEFFPEPEEFLKDLHEKDLHVTLNLHPADGIKGHEDNYLPMAKHMGVDFENEERIPFDVTDEKFMEGYFKYIHNPLEDDGVDFWWVDWQQGETTRTPGIDPLWMLNHLHYLDNARDGKRPLTFSRYAGLGSHRYPVGFSGDTVSSWDSLRFQPYFTATASNAGYSWWSHDIGGHQMGEKDDEMVTRWIQFGVFSPIMRLHSTANPFYGKEPWNYGPEAQETISKYLRLRHSLIPYLYTANYRTAQEGIPLIRPMYYKWDCDEAYSQKNQYCFGENMIVCPVTEPMDKKLHLAKVTAWIPEGTYYDFFTHNIYSGNRTVNMYRGLNDIPVLVKAGSIVPTTEGYMDAHINNPKDITLKVFHGGNGSYTMIEDDCSNQADSSEISYSDFSYSCENEPVFSFERRGASVVPEDRDYTVEFIGIDNPDNVSITSKDHKPMSLRYEYDEDKKTLTAYVTGKDIVDFELHITVNDMGMKDQDKLAQLYEIINRMEISYDLKNQVYQIAKEDISPTDKLSRLLAVTDNIILIGAIVELIV